VRRSVDGWKRHPWSARPIKVTCGHPDDQEVTYAVEGNEVMLRIVWRHRWLLVLMVVLPIVVVLPLRLGQSVNYTATADIQTQAVVPSASTQVSSILSQVSAIATSPAAVQKAIAAAKVDRNAIDVAKHQISTSSLDSSGIVAVTVKDPDRQVAAKLSRALAGAIVETLNAPGTAASQQLQALTRQEAQLNATRESLVSELNTDQISGLATTAPQVQAAITELTGVESELATNQTAQQQILSSNNANEDASVLSEPTVATTTYESRNVLVYAALAGLLGLIIGLLIATIDELIRPTVADPEAGARELGVAFLGNAETAEEEKAADAEEEKRDKELIVLDGDLVTRMRLAADRLGALTLVLTGPVPSLQLTQLTEEMNRRLSAAEALRDHETPPRPNERTGTLASSGRNGRKINRSTAVKAPALALGSVLSTLKVHALSDLNLKSRPEAPTILVALRRFSPRASLDRVADLGETTGWPILGVVGIRQKPRTRGNWHALKSLVTGSRGQSSTTNGSQPTNEWQSTNGSQPANESSPTSESSLTNGSQPTKVAAPAPAPYHDEFVPRRTNQQGHLQ
jgi:capsular polysaccharide biosynthesis protein